MTGAAWLVSSTGAGAPGVVSCWALAGPAKKQSAASKAALCPVRERGVTLRRDAVRTGSAREYNRTRTGNFPVETDRPIRQEPPANGQASGDPHSPLRDRPS